MEDERPAHAKRATEKPGLEHDVVPRRGLSLGAVVRWVAGPVVLGEDERGEVDFVRQLDQPIERRDARVEDRGPRFDVRDVGQPAREHLHELRLLAR